MKDNNVAGERWGRLMKEAQRLLQEDMETLTRGIFPMDYARLGELLSGVKPPSHNPYRALGLDPLAPDEVVKLVYKYLAQRLHPDHGGSTEAMARLNLAYEEIAKMRGWR